MFSYTIYIKNTVILILKQKLAISKHIHLLLVFLQLRFG